MLPLKSYHKECLPNPSKLRLVFSALGVIFFRTGGGVLSKEGDYGEIILNRISVRVRIKCCLVTHFVKI